MSYVDEKQKEFVKIIPLSDLQITDKRIHNNVTIDGLFRSKDVKQFIKDLKNEWPDADAVHATIDKLAGENLI